MSAKLINCSVCGTEMASTAKACPKCGAKNKKPFNKKPLFVILLIIVVLFGGIKVMNSLGASELTFPSGETLTAKQLLKADNTSAYENYHCDIVMTVSKVDANATQVSAKDGLYLELDNSEWSEHREILETLHKGDKIKVRARLSSVTTFWVVIQDVKSITLI